MKGGAVLADPTEKAFDNPKFTDSEGREWDCSFRWSHLNRVRQASRVWLPDLLKPESSTMTLIAEEPEAIQKAVLALLGPQMKKRGVSKEDFLDSVDGDVEEAIFDALCSAVVFSLPARARDQGRKQFNFQRKVTTELIDKAQTLQSETLSQLRADSPAPAGSTTETSHSGSSENSPKEPEVLAGSLPATQPGTLQPLTAETFLTVE